jgi:hypothetical protein
MTTKSHKSIIKVEKKHELAYVHSDDTDDENWDGERVKLLDSDGNFECFVKSIDYAEGYLIGKYGQYLLEIPFDLDFNYDIWS